MTVTLRELADRLGLTTSALRRALMEGRLQARRSGNTWLFDEAQQQAATALRWRRRVRRKAA